MKMSFKDFSKQLILTKDLDPDYILMRSMDVSYAVKLFWIQCKIFIYDSASEIKYINRKHPWEKLELGAERRKNKQKGERQLLDFTQHFSLKEMPLNYTEAKVYLTDFDGIGSWAAWKFCDLLERVLEHPVDFSNVDFRKAYEYPLKGLAAVIGHPDEYVKDLCKHDSLYRQAMYQAIAQLGDVLDLEAPCGRRTINIQEIETCLCKYHSYLSGHYYIGKDTEHLVKRLEEEAIIYPKNIFELPQQILNL